MQEEYFKVQYPCVLFEPQELYFCTYESYVTSNDIYILWYIFVTEWARKYTYFIHKWSRLNLQHKYAATYHYLGCGSPVSYQFVLCDFCRHLWWGRQSRASQAEAGIQNVQEIHSPDNYSTVSHFRLPFNRRAVRSRRARVPCGWRTCRATRRRCPCGVIVCIFRLG